MRDIDQIPPPVFVARDGRWTRAGGVDADGGASKDTCESPRAVFGQRSAYWEATKRTESGST